jgi:hypothetical protein
MAHHQQIKNSISKVNAPTASAATATGQGTYTGFQASKIKPVMTAAYMGEDASLL